MEAIWAALIWLLTMLALAVPGTAPFLRNVQDQDLVRHADVLKSDGITTEHHLLRDGGILFPLTVLRMPESESGPVFVILHDDEDTAFDTGLAALRAYGGRMIILEANERRRLSGIDPNRLFEQPDFPKFTTFFADAIGADETIIALHNNRDGYGPGKGSVSVQRWLERQGRFTAIDNGDDEDNFILTSGSASADQDERFQSLQQAMAPRSINVVYEQVFGLHDHSMAVWAAREGRAYYNIEAEHGDERAQARMIGALLRHLTPERLSTVQEGRRFHERG